MVSVDDEDLDPGQRAPLFPTRAVLPDVAGGVSRVCPPRHRQPRGWLGPSQRLGGGAAHPSETTRARSGHCSTPSTPRSTPASPSTSSWTTAPPRVEKDKSLVRRPSPLDRALQPPHASWVNQIELFFSILQPKVLRNGNFDFREDLIAKLLAFISDYDETAKPFAWTYSGDPPKVA